MIRISTKTVRLLRPTESLSRHKPRNGLLADISGSEQFPETEFPSKERVTPPPSTVTSPEAEGLSTNALLVANELRKEVETVSQIIIEGTSLPDGDDALPGPSKPRPETHIPSGVMIGFVPRTGPYPH